MKVRRSRESSETLQLKQAWLVRTGYRALVNKSLGAADVGTELHNTPEPAASKAPAALSRATWVLLIQHLQDRTTDKQVPQDECFHHTHL